MELTEAQYEGIAFAASVRRSALCMRRPPAAGRMVFVRSDPNRTRGLAGLGHSAGLADLISSTVSPYSVRSSCPPHLPAASSSFALFPPVGRSGSSGSPVVLFPRGQRPDAPGRPVGERHRARLPRLARQHRGQPRSVNSPRRTAWRTTAMAPANRSRLSGTDLTSCPSARISRPQWWVPAHVSVTTYASVAARRLGSRPRLSFQRYATDPSALAPDTRKLRFARSIPMMLAS